MGVGVRVGAGVTVGTTVTVAVAVEVAVGSISEIASGASGQKLSNRMASEIAAMSI